MERKKKHNTKYSPEFKKSVIMDMRENHLAYRETVRKYWNTRSRAEDGDQKADRERSRCRRKSRTISLPRTKD